MDCKDVDAILMDYLYQELEAGQAEHVEAHLRACPRCAGELSAFEHTRKTMRELPELAPPAGIDELLLQEAAKAVRLQPEPAPGFWQRVRASLRVLALNPAMAGAVAVVVVLGVTFAIYRHAPSPTSKSNLEEPAPTLAPVETASREETGSQLAGIARDEDKQLKKREQVAQQAAPQAETDKEEKSNRAPVRIAKGAPYSAEDQRGGAGGGAVGAGGGAVGAGGGAVGAGFAERKAKAANVGPRTSRTESLARTTRSAPAARPVAAAAPAKDALAKAEQPKAAEVQGKLVNNETVFKKSAANASKGDDLDALADSSQAPVGKAKLGQAASGGKQAAAPIASSADYWLKQGMSAQRRGDCGQALSYFERALALNAKLSNSVGSLVRSCAVTLDEKALAAARKQNPRLAGMLNVEVARRAKARAQKEADLESTSGKKAAKPAKAAPAAPSSIKAN